jgi:hypothetical protein
MVRSLIVDSGRGQPEIIGRPHPHHWGAAGRQQPEIVGRPHPHHWGVAHLTILGEFLIKILIPPDILTKMVSGRRLTNNHVW